MGNILQGLVAFGVGSILTTVLQFYFNERTKRKTLLFQEKKEAFVGLLTAYHNAAVEHSDKNSKEFAYWQMRCELVCDIPTKVAIQNIVDSNDKPERQNAHESLKECLSSELARLI